VSPILTKGTIDVITHSAKQTQALGQRLGGLLRPGDVVCLQGELGSGKTCFAKGIGAGLGVESVVHSPTFVLINEHAVPTLGARLYHVALYRLSGCQEALAMGLEDLFYGDGIVVIEWAERVDEILPPSRLWVQFTYLDDTKRSLHVSADGERLRHVVDALQAQLTGRSPVDEREGASNAAGD